MWSLSFSCFLTTDVSCSKLPVKSDVASRGCIFSFCPGCRIPVHPGQSSTLLTWLAAQMKTSHWELVNTNGISGWLCCPASGWDWVDFFWICVSIYQLNYEYQCSHSDPALKHNKSQLCNNCALHLFCFPWSLLHVVVSFWAYFASCWGYLGNNKDRNCTESVTARSKIWMWKLTLDTWCIEIGFVRLNISADLNSLQIIQICIALKVNQVLTWSLPPEFINKIELRVFVCCLFFYKPICCCFVEWWDLEAGFSWFLLCGD